MIAAINELRRRVDDAVKSVDPILRNFRKMAILVVASRKH